MEPLVLSLLRTQGVGIIVRGAHSSGLHKGRGGGPSLLPPGTASYWVPQVWEAGGCSREMSFHSVGKGRAEGGGGAGGADSKACCSFATGASSLL